MSFAKSWQEKGWSSQAETWQVKNILMNDFDWQVKYQVFVVSMATWTIEYNLKISLLLSLHKIRSLDFPINLHTAYSLIITIWNLLDQILTVGFLDNQQLKYYKRKNSAKYHKVLMRRFWEIVFCVQLLFSPPCLFV